VESRRRLQIALLVVGLLGCVLRLSGIDGSLSLDETRTLWITSGTFGELSERATLLSPLYYTLPWAAGQVFGESEVVLRLPSLVLAVLAGWLIARTGACFGRRHVALLAVTFFWLDARAVWISCLARPYVLAHAFTALMLFGFLRATQTGSARYRVLWSIGSLGVFWSHYCLSLQAAGLALAYLLWPDLRRRYRPSQFACDVGLQLLGVAFRIPQLLAVSGEVGIQWGIGFDPVLNLAAPVRIAGLPIFVALCGYALRPATLKERAPEAGVLWCVVIVPVALSLLLIPFGVNLLVERYQSALSVPAAILAARSVASLSPRRALGLLLVWVCAVGWVHERGQRLQRSFSHVGEDDSRRAVEVLGAALEEEDAPVLYRSGYVDDDHVPSGRRDMEEMRPPLRHPGGQQPDWTLVPLTYLWSAPGRGDYFEEAVAPALAGHDVFYLITHTNGGRGRGYLERLKTWLDERVGPCEVETLHDEWSWIVLRYRRL
jgi:4-amino-4-deoxy-L-arabinose transferase-like glycosyltransferase